MKNITCVFVPIVIDYSTKIHLVTPIERDNYATYWDNKFTQLILEVQLTLGIHFYTGCPAVVLPLSFLKL
jgi:hypothetical protein